MSDRQHIQALAGCGTTMKRYEVKLGKIEGWIDKMC
jgi:hypothetical protein